MAELFHNSFTDELAKDPFHVEIYVELGLGYRQMVVTAIKKMGIKGAVIVSHKANHGEWLKCLQDFHVSGVIVVEPRKTHHVLCKCDLLVIDLAFFTRKIARELQDEVTKYPACWVLNFREDLTLQHIPAYSKFRRLLFTTSRSLINQNREQLIGEQNHGS